MKSPFATAPAVLNPPSEKQRSYLIALAQQKANIQGKELDYERTVEFIDRLSRKEASEHIDRLKDELIVLRRESNQAPIAGGDSPEGFWELSDGRIVKVQLAVHGSGNFYGKVLDTDSGRFEYTEGILAEVRKSGTRLPLDRAKELGKLYGRCICCGRTLTDEFSIANGIGPVCIQKF